MSALETSVQRNFPATLLCTVASMHLHHSAQQAYIACKSTVATTGSCYHQLAACVLVEHDK
eukprot:2540091-Pleurochrysis_carterae.AAC.1